MTNFPRLFLTAGLIGSLNLSCGEKPPLPPPPLVGKPVEVEKETKPTEVENVTKAIESSRDEIDWIGKSEEEFVRAWGKPLNIETIKSTGDTIDGSPSKFDLTKTAHRWLIYQDFVAAVTAEGKILSTSFNLHKYQKR